MGLYQGKMAIYSDYRICAGKIFSVLERNADKEEIFNSLFAGYVVARFASQRYNPRSKAAGQNEGTC